MFEFVVRPKTNKLLPLQYSDRLKLYKQPITIVHYIHDLDTFRIQLKEGIIEYFDSLNMSENFMHLLRSAFEHNVDTLEI